MSFDLLGTLSSLRSWSKNLPPPYSGFLNIPPFDHPVADTLAAAGLLGGLGLGTAASGLASGLTSFLSKSAVSSLLTRGAIVGAGALGGKDILSAVLPASTTSYGSDTSQNPYTIPTSGQQSPSITTATRPRSYHYTTYKYTTTQLRRKVFKHRLHKKRRRY